MWRPVISPSSTAPPLALTSEPPLCVRTRGVYDHDSDPPRSAAALILTHGGHHSELASLEARDLARPTSCVKAFFCFPNLQTPLRPREGQHQREKGATDERRHALRAAERHAHKAEDASVTNRSNVGASGAAGTAAGPLYGLVGFCLHLHVEMCDNHCADAVQQREAIGH